MVSFARKPSPLSQSGEDFFSSLPGLLHTASLALKTFLRSALFCDFETRLSCVKFSLVRKGAKAVNKARNTSN